MTGLSIKVGAWSRVEEVMIAISSRRRGYDRERGVS